MLKPLVCLGFAAAHPDVVADLQSEVEAHRRGMKAGPPLFDAVTPSAPGR